MQLSYIIKKICSDTAQIGDIRSYMGCSYDVVGIDQNGKFSILWHNKGNTTKQHPSWSIGSDQLIGRKK